MNEINLYELFKPGEKIYGYCYGYFGRDDYKAKIVVSVRPQYVLFEYTDGSGATVLNEIECRNITRTEIEEWMIKGEYDED